MNLPLNDPTQWPLRMIRAEAAYVMRRSQRSLREWIAEGKFPPPDDGRTWDREVVAKYARGGVREFMRRAERAGRRTNLRSIDSVACR